MDGFSKLRAKLERDEKERRTNLLALVSHINSTPAWDGALRFNLLTEGYEICGPFPPLDRPKEKPRPLEDPRDILRATMYFQANGFPKSGKAGVSDAIAAVEKPSSGTATSYGPKRGTCTAARSNGGFRPISRR
jgi:hypothetical protein